MTPPAIFYIPLLHREWAPDEILDIAASGLLSFVPVGLAAPVRESSSEEPLAPAAGFEREAARALPLSPPEARAALAEMLRLGEELGPENLMRAITHKDDTKTRRIEEHAALEAFAATGTFTPHPPGAAPATLAENLRQTRINCHKTLLLIHAFEESSREAMELERRFSLAEQRLAELLGEGDSQAADAPPLTPPAGLPWRAVLNAALPFLPADAVLFSADACVSADLAQTAALHPLPEDMAAKLCPLWPEALKKRLIWAEMSAWKLAGRQAAPERPWLEGQRQVLILPAGKPLEETSETARESGASGAAT